MTRDQHEGAPLSDELLQRYFDDELPGPERQAVEGRLDAEARARLLALEELGGLLRGHASLEADEADLSTSFSATLRAIERGVPPPATSVGRGRRSTWRSGALLGGLLAGATALAFFFAPGRGVDLAANDTEVETLEVQGSVATVFRVEHAGDPAQSTTVIWAALEADEGDAAEGVVGPPEIDEDEREAL